MHLIQFRFNILTKAIIEDYQNRMKTNSLASQDVSDAVIKENLHRKFWTPTQLAGCCVADNKQLNLTSTSLEKRAPTALWGSMFAILRAWTMASSHGLQRIGDLGSSILASGWDKYPRMSKISVSSEDGEFSGGFNVSKHMIPSKQSSNPSLLRTLAAWILSPFVNICFQSKWMLRILGSRISIKIEATMFM